jgi:hypothetical protein
MRARAYSFTTVADDGVHHEAMRVLEEGVRTEYGEITAFVEVSNETRLALIKL